MKTNTYNTPQSRAAAKRLAKANLERRLAENDVLLAMGYNVPEDAYLTIEELSKPLESCWEYSEDEQEILKGLIAASQYRDFECERYALNEKLKELEESQ